MHVLSEQTSYGAPTFETSDWILLAAIAAVFVVMGVVMFMRRLRHQT